MAFTDDLLDLMPVTVTVSTFAGLSTDGYVTESFTTGSSTYSARVVGRQQLVRTFSGEEELASTVAWIASTSTFGPVDQITLPDGTTPPILNAEALMDEIGVTHSKVFFG